MALRKYPLALALLLTGCFLNENAQGKISFSATQSASIQSAQTKLLAVTALAEGMSTNSYTKPLVSSTNFGAKLSAARGKANAIETKLLGEDDAEGKAERISGALTGVSDGLVGMIGGIKDGDWVQGVQGALGMISSMVALAGPIGMVASSIMSMVSGFLGLFGGSETESQESMIKRVVEAAINDARHRDMKEYIEGAKHVYQSLSSSVQNFRERGQLTSSQAEELYNHAFSELQIFGQLKARIAEVCTKPDDTTKATTCLDFLQLYAEMSILRQLILADMASLLSEPEINLLSTGNNLLHLIKKEQESDKAVIAPYADPLNNPEKRRAIALLFGSPETYSLLNAYMRTLHDVVDGEIFRDFVVVCNTRMLGDFCSGLETKEYNKLSEVSWNRIISSMYIPRGKEVTAWVNDDFQGNALGPFVGPVVHGLVPSENKWKSMKIVDTEDSIDEQVRFCENENMNPDGLCDSSKPSGNTIFLTGGGTRNYHGTDWANKVKSLYVPAGLNISGFDSSVSGSVADQFGPYYGPQRVNKVCYKTGKLWNAIGIHVTKGETDAEGNEITPPKDARRMVQFCDGENLKGMCLRDDETRTSLTALKASCNFDKKIKSMKVPGGLQVTAYRGPSHTDRRYGPYIGPVTLNYVDEPASWMSYKIESTIVVPGTTSAKKAKKKSRSKKSHKKISRKFAKKHLAKEYGSWKS